MVFDIVVGCLGLCAVLTAIWHEEKLIQFEDWLWEKIKDRIAYVIAKIIIWYRRHLEWVVDIMADRIGYAAAMVVLWYRRNFKKNKRKGVKK